MPSCHPGAEGLTTKTKEFSVFRVTEHGKNEVDSIVVSEFPLTVILDNQELVTLLCSPTNLEYLAIGFLFTAGFINGKEEIKKITVDEQRGVVRIARNKGTEFANELLFKRLITSACGRGAAFYSAADTRHLTKVESQARISANEIFSLVDEFNQHSMLFKETGGVHGAALTDTKSILVFSDDLGRYNAIDKVFGECILEGIPTEGRVIITSGRTPSEMILKVAKGNVPILISVGATTDLGIRLANDLGVTLIGFVRGKEMTVYTNDWRVAGDLEYGCYLRKN